MKKTLLLVLSILFVASIATAGFQKNKKHDSSIDVNIFLGTFKLIKADSEYCPSGIKVTYIKEYDEGLAYNFYADINIDDLDTEYTQGWGTEFKDFGYEETGVDTYYYYSTWIQEEKKGWALKKLIKDGRSPNVKASWTILKNNPEVGVYTNPSFDGKCYFKRDN